MADTERTFRIAKVDEAQHLVFGFGSVAVTAEGEPIVDSQDDMIEPAELESAVYDYVLKSREGDVNHDESTVARLVESLVITPEKLEKMGLPKDSLPTSWWLGFHVEDEAVWKRVAGGELKAFSIGGTAKRVPVTAGGA
jgi:hypothetical protein